MTWLPLSWLIDTLIATGVLIALVLVLRGPVSRHFGPGMAYALWALPLLRLVIPPLVLPTRQAAVVPVVLTEPALAGRPVEPAVTTPLDLGWVEPLLLGLWLAGAVGFLVWRIVGYRRLRDELLADARPVGCVGDIRLIESPATVSPLAFGLFDKVIALPPGYMTIAERKARDLAIAHELEHHAGRDIAVNMAVQPLLALHWFNPLAWLAWRALRRDQEAACDARVVAGRDSATRAAYGALIADFARAPRTSLAASLACPVVGEASIVHRLRNLTMSDPTPARRNIGRLLLAGAALALPLTASVTYAADPADPATPKVETRKRIMIVEHEGGADPKDAKLETRVIEKDGKTIVLKTSKPLTEAEVQEHIAKAEAGMKDAEAMAWTSKAKDGNGKTRVFTLVRKGDAAADGEAKPGEKRRVFVMSGDSVDIAGDEAASMVTFHQKDGKAPSFAMVSHGSVLACVDGDESAKVSEQVDSDGKRQAVKMRFCHKGGTPAMALEAMKKARARMAENNELSGEIKERVLKSLDEQIEKMSKQD
jgi:beta-lactamase regulating signal transducer with metallopeptidase domain